MSYFLVVYDRREGRVLREVTFADRRDALRARFDAEDARPEGSDIEVIVLAARSHSALRTTHGRYFKSAVELAHAALAST